MNHTKRSFILLLLFYCTLVLTACFYGSTGSSAETPTISDEHNILAPDDSLLRQLEKDYLNHLQKTNSSYNPELDGVYSIKFYYGEYDDCILVMFSQPETGTYQTVKVAESVFHYVGNNTIQVWKNGEFFSMQEAYEHGFLTSSDVAMIANIHNNNKYYICP